MKFENTLEQRVHRFLQHTEDVEERAKLIGVQSYTVEQYVARYEKSDKTEADYRRMVGGLKIEESMARGRKNEREAVHEAYNRYIARRDGGGGSRVPFVPGGAAKEKVDVAKVVLGIKPLDWTKAFEEVPDEIDWLVPDFLEAGKSYALYAAAKEGKSLLLQDVMARLAAGQSIFDRDPVKPRKILYIDMENTVVEIVDRMKDYGMGPEDLANLKYLWFPTLPPMDTEDGGKVLKQLALKHGAEIVVIDTLSRVIGGGENDSDTMHQLYRHSLAPLKALGIAVVRLDHAGKDVNKGQRGSSAKTTDVDVVWRLNTVEERWVTLTREETRNANHPEGIRLERVGEPLRHTFLGFGKGTARAGTDTVLDLVDMLDKLDTPLDWGRDRCRDVLLKEGVRANNADLAAAIKTRKGVSDDPFAASKPVRDRSSAPDCPQDQDS